MEIENRKSKIVLIGFMGAGKTTIAKALAEKLDCNFVDLDAFIESRERHTIASIIDTEGEARFREIESKTLKDMLQNDSAKIIALGGGTWTIEENRKLISEKNCLTVWLDVPFEVCWERIIQTGDTRPLARNKAKAKKLYEVRREVYKSAALKVNADEGIERSIASIVRAFYENE